MKKYILCLLGVVLFVNCSAEKRVEKPVREDFAKGADVSWVTQMESEGVKFYTRGGEPSECMSLLKSYGMNSIRLRVWVDPNDGWCAKEDVLIKAKRAAALGMRIMIDFHYSDFWADPGKQNKPKAWENLPFEELTTALENHTKEVLRFLKEGGVSVEWVQVGNETGAGMLWPDGKFDNLANYAKLNNAGYDGVKSVFPNAKVVVHLQNGDDNGLFRWFFDALKENGGKWDMIGMSLYPNVESWQTAVNKCIANVDDVVLRYGTQVVICEVGMPWDKSQVANMALGDLITKAQGNKDCVGVFYWEPQAYKLWSGYSLSAFDNEGKPTEALNAFK